MRRFVQSNSSCRQCDLRMEMPLVCLELWIPASCEALVFQDWRARYQPTFSHHESQSVQPSIRRVPQRVVSCLVRNPLCSSSDNQANVLRWYFPLQQLLFQGEE